MAAGVLFPKPHDQVLLALAGFGAAGILAGSFLNRAPNRLANGVATALWHAPPLEAGAAMAGLAALAALAFHPKDKPRSAMTFGAAMLILWGCLSGAGRLASLFALSDPSAARYSLGAAFWILMATALLALLDAAQRANLGLLARAGLIAALGAGFALTANSGAFADLSLAKEFASHRDIFFIELRRHIVLVASAVFFALAISAPLTALVLRRPSARGLVFSGLGILQTIPSIALFGLLMAPLTALSQQFPLLRAWGINGAGAAPAIIALTLYSLLPLTRGFFTGVSEVAADVKDAAAGMGFSARQTFLLVELPLAWPALVSGLRVVTIQAIGLAAVAALIGAGGLGAFVFQGIGQYALDLVLVGAIPIILQALAASFGFQMLLAARRGS
ncbi:ABC transporter permease [Methylocapsa palsarum]|uniref:Osmoprotectant transport system permease protein n=1 Tax=Methylocapsa palsarum TaxID=1612308 RepID=A0A1I3YME8_9HYPH|nr:ABC transporter permease [Methylocapsa palsarum]SFK32930.1 osmoprotectant transport system permease protein [Methylocapsa palsarum]